MLQPTLQKGSISHRSVKSTMPIGKIYQQSHVRQQNIEIPSVSSLLTLESSSILSKKVIGKEDVDIAALILKLGNSDWVKQGLVYLERSEEKCPFCQQDLLVDIRTSLSDYFDESYQHDVAEIQNFHDLYSHYSQTLLAELNVITSNAACPENHPIRSDIELLNQRLGQNIQRIEDKKREPSVTVTLDSIQPLTEQIVMHLSQLQATISRHNILIDNLESEKTKLTAEVWRYIVDELRRDTEKYTTEKENLDKAVSGLTTGISQKTLEISRIGQELKELESKVTSVQPTVDGINGILKSLGFTGFELAPAGEKNHLYTIIRRDGASATETLSEGERSFVTFLYFYHSLRGNTSPSGTTSDLVVVFDDPISSLDSDVLFIVSTLIREVVAEVRQGTGRIKQVFVLTHNVYFHKEVTFDTKRDIGGCRSDETFWIVRKRDDYSTLTKYPFNPIKTSYELLWAEIKTQKENPSSSQVTIQNTMRRIIEHYFKILGNLDKDDIIEQFSGKEKQACSSLFSWMNGGSHSIHDELHTSPDTFETDLYLRVFKNIFEKMQHTAHYDMMMGGAISNQPESHDNKLSPKHMAA